MEQLPAGSVTLLLILILWALPWKAYSLWTASKNNHKIWFIILVFLNTFGILDIIYVFLIAKKKWSDIGNAFLRLLSPKK